MSKSAPLESPLEVAAPHFEKSRIATHLYAIKKRLCEHESLIVKIEEYL